MSRPGATVSAAIAMTPRYLRCFTAALAFYAFVVFILSGMGDEKFEHLHLLLDTGNGILSLLLAVFLLGEQHEIRSSVRIHLAIGFAVAAATELLHALVGIEWSGWFAWIETYSHILRPATWPPSTYVLPLSMAWAIWLMRRGSALRPAVFAAVTVVLAVVLIAVSYALPKYVDTGLLGIQRPTQIPLLFLWLVVIAACWRERRTTPLFEGLALMGVVLFLSDLCMLYSTSPHEKFTMMAHAGKFVAYSLLHVIQMGVAAADSRARSVAEAALVQERENLRAALNALRHQKFALDQHSIVCTTDASATITYANRRFCEISGYTEAELLGKNHRMFNSGTHPAEFFRDMFRTITAGRVWRGEICNRAKDGGLYWVMTTIVPYLDEQQDKVTQYIALRTDITARKAIERQLHDHQAQLEAQVRQRTADLEQALAAAQLAERAKDQFLANISHELRTPLNAVIGLSDLARKLSRDTKQQDYLSKVTSAGNTLAHLINDLLDLSKIAAGRMAFDCTTFSLRRLVQRSNSVIAHKAAEKGLVLVELIDDAVPDALIGDSLRIEQILLNLMSNAIKFTDVGRVELRIGVHAREARRVGLSIDVEDTGVGLRDEDIANLFKPFAQADSTTTRKYGGTGLGLAICKRLAEMMDGGISVSSRAGRGSLFSVKLWLGVGDAADLPHTPTPAGEDAGVLRYVNANVLVVEDQPLNREIVEALLAIVGITPQMATNGREALDLLAASGPDAFDLVLMDVQMPVIDGLAATREIRTWAGFEALPIVAMTAHTMAHEREIGAAAGMNDHIGKPFDNPLFYATLAKWIPAAKRQGPARPSPSGSSLPAGGGLHALSGIDTAAGLARFVGNEARYRHWLAKFVDQGPAAVGTIRQGLADGTPEAARQAAHALKGLVGMLGMTDLHAIATELDAALKRDDPAADWVAALDRAVDRTRAEITAALGLPEAG